MNTENTIMAELLSFEFMRHAIIAGLLASVLCGIIGTFVVVKRLVFISGGISHAAFGGLGLFYYLGLNPVIGAILVAVAAALALGGSQEWRQKSGDAIIGVFWTVGMALGIVFISRTPGFAPNLMTYLFGNILMVSTSDIWMTSSLVLVVLLVLILFYHEFIAISFDEEFTRSQGLQVRGLFMLLLTLVALTVVMLIQVVGIILVIALLTIPPLISLMLARSFTGVILLSIVIGILITLSGLALSYYQDLPSGPVIILMGAVLLFLIRFLKRHLHRIDDLPINRTISA